MYSLQIVQVLFFSRCTVAFTLITHHYHMNSQSVKVPKVRSLLSFVTREREVVETVGKAVAELVGAELGSKSLRPSFQKLLANFRPKH